MSDLKDYYLLCCPCVAFVLTFFTFTLSVPGVLRSGTRKALCCLPLCYSITIYRFYGKYSPCFGTLFPASPATELYGYFSPPIAIVDMPIWILYVGIVGIVTGCLASYSLSTICELPTEHASHHRQNPRCLKLVNVYIATASSASDHITQLTPLRSTILQQPQSASPG